MELVPVPTATPEVILSYDITVELPVGVWKARASQPNIACDPMVVTGDVEFVDPALLIFEVRSATAVLTLQCSAAVDLLFENITPRPVDDSVDV